MGRLQYSDSEHYGGSGRGNLGEVESDPVPADGHPHSLTIVLPALSALFFEAE